MDNGTVALLVAAVAALGTLGKALFDYWGKRREVRVGLDNNIDRQEYEIRAELREENKELKIQNKELREANVTLKELLDKAKQEVALLQQERTEHLKQIDALRSTISIMESKLDRVEAELYRFREGRHEK